MGPHLFASGSSMGNWTFDAHLYSNLTIWITQGFPVEETLCYSQYCSLQGHLESYFGIYSIRIENVGVSRPLSDDLHIQGIASPITFRKVILTRLHSMWDKRFYDQISTKPDMLGQCSGHLRASMPSSSSCKNEDLVNEEVILQKLEEVESHVKNVQNLIEKKSSRDDVS